MKRRWVLNLLSQFLFNLGSNEGKIDFTGGKLANTLGLKAGVFGGFNKTQADIFGSTLSGAVTTPANIIADKATEKKPYNE